jgi:hypothetical protein
MRHERATFRIDQGVAWSWNDPAARDRDAAVRAALLALTTGEDAAAPTQAAP